MTAVQELKYLFDDILKSRGVVITWDTYLAQEKQQIIDAYKRESVYMYHAGCSDEQINRSADKYYTSTYGSKGSDVKDYTEAQKNEERVNNAEIISDATSSQTENKGLDWLVSHWKKLKSEGEKMNWEQIIQITELAKDVPSSQTERMYSEEEVKSAFKKGFYKWNEPIEISDDEIEKGAKEWYNKEGAYSASAIALKTWVYAIRWYREQLKK